MKANEDSFDPVMTSSVFSKEANESFFATMEIVVRRYFRLSSDNLQDVLKNSDKLLVHDLLCHVGRLSKANQTYILSLVASCMEDTNALSHIKVIDKGCATRPWLYMKMPYKEDLKKMNLEAVARIVSAACHPSSKDALEKI